MTLFHSLIEETPDLPVDQVIVGIFNVGVSVKSRIAAGIAATITGNDRNNGIAPGALRGKNLRELAMLVLSQTPLEASVGLAAINAGIACNENFGNRKYVEINGRELLLEKGKNKSVASIGRFPFLDKISNAFRCLEVFEKQPGPSDLPETDIPARLLEAEVVIITGTTLSNHSFDSIVPYLNPKAYVIMLGPSTPVSPILLNSGINAVCGVQIQDSSGVMASIKEGVHTRDIRGIKQIALIKEDLDL